MWRYLSRSFDTTSSASNSPLSPIMTTSAIVWPSTCRLRNNKSISLNCLVTGIGSFFVSENWTLSLTLYPVTFSLQTNTGYSICCLPQQRTSLMTSLFGPEWSPSSWRRSSHPLQRCSKEVYLHQGSFFHVLVPARVLKQCYRESSNLSTGRVCALTSNVELKNPESIKLQNHLFLNPLGTL